MNPEVRIIGVSGLPEIAPGTNLARAIHDAAQAAAFAFAAGDVLIVTQKIVSKAEGRLVDLSTVTPSAFAEGIAPALAKDARLVEVVLRESRRIVKMDRGTIITETHHGLVCANAGVDESNVAGGRVALLPVDPDGSAQRLREGLRELSGLDLAVVISDTFGRPWREGFVNVAIGVAGLEPIKDYRGLTDPGGHVLKATILAVADELASAAELVMGKVDGVPVAVVRGYAYGRGEGRARSLVRPPETDLFR
jgi:coenzyme F420-0:L-glutamate ligase/coenzyme F420-1:gamma-L-glutamate ligase